MRLIGMLQLAGLFAVSAYSATINFSTFGGARYAAVTSFTENGFTVTATSGSWYYETLQGNTAPEIKSQNGAGAALTVTGTGGFFFDKVDLGNNSLPHTITGFLAVVQQFTFSGTTAAGFVPDGIFPAIGGNTYTTVNNAYSTTLIDSLSITGTSYGALNAGVDNIVMTAAEPPEPGTLTLFGGAFFLLSLLKGFRPRCAGGKM